jgi:hypothetical protein
MRRITLHGIRWCGTRVQLSHDHTVWSHCTFALSFCRLFSHRLVYRLMQIILLVVFASLTHVRVCPLRGTESGKYNSSIQALKC